MKRDCDVCGKAILHLRPDATITTHSFCRQVESDEPRIMSRAEWLEWRMGGIGGTDAADIMDDDRIERCWAIKTGRCGEDPENYAMSLGRRMESAARREYESLRGVQVRPAYIEHRRDRYRRLSCDGWHPSETTVEIKISAREKHELVHRGQLPREHRWQLVHHLAVLERPSVDLFSYLPKPSEDYRDPFSLPRGLALAFERDREAEAQLLEREKYFWDCVLDGAAPTRKVVYLHQSKRSNIFSFRRSR